MPAQNRYVAVQHGKVKEIDEVAVLRGPLLGARCGSEGLPMNPNPRLAAVALAALLALAPTFAAAQSAPTSDQRRALGKAEADRLIRKDLLSLLRPLPGGFGGGNARRLREQTLFTRAYGTAYENLCRTDLLTVEYAPTDGRERYEHSPIAPYGLSVDTWYHLAGPPKRKAAADADRQVWDEACTQLRPETYIDWFDAPSEEDAALAGNVLSAVIERVRAGTLKPGSCEGLHDEKKSCAAVVLETGERMERVSRVIVCEAPAGRSCYRIEVGWDTALTVVFTRKPGSIVPEGIDSLQVEQFVFVT